MTPYIAFLCSTWKDLWMIVYKGREWQHSKTGFYLTLLELTQPRASRLLDSWESCKECVGLANDADLEDELWNDLYGQLAELNVQFCGELFDIIFSRKTPSKTIIRVLVTKVQFDK